MQEPYDHREREDKLEGRELHLGRRGDTVRRDRPHGKLYRWFDNFWYHNKWKTIIISFFVIVFIVCTASMCSKAPEADVSLLIAGPTNFASEESGTVDLEALLAGYVTSDRNGDGRKDVDIRYYTVLSADQILTLEAVELDDGNKLYVDRSVSSSNYSNFYSYLATGDTTVMILDRWLFEELKNSRLVNLSTQFDTVPKGAILEEGGAYYGISLKDTALYQTQSSMQVLEEDYIETEPVICIMSKLLTGVDDDGYKAALAFLRSLVG